MKIRLLWAASAFTIASSLALAQQSAPSAAPGAQQAAQDAAKANPDAPQGIVTVVNRIDGTIGIIKPTGNTESDKGAVEQFKVKDAAMLDNVHAGDEVTYALSDDNGARTITKLDEQKSKPVVSTPTPLPMPFPRR